MKKSNFKTKIKKIIKICLVLSLIAYGLNIYSTDILKNSLDISRKYGMEMLLIFPAVLGLMALADIWISKSLIEKHLGKDSGIKGIFWSVILGALPTGPMYVAFPIAHELLDKKASVTNVIVFLGVWASLKIPQIGVEIKFMGLNFAILRFVFTLISLIIMGLLINVISKKQK